MIPSHFKNRTLLYTEGVFLFGSAMLLKKRYSSSEFDYEYPNGIMSNINNNELFAITMDSGRDTIFTIFDSIEEYDDFTKNIEWTLNTKVFIDILANDEFFVIDHGSFTMACDCEGGDLSNDAVPDRLRFICIRMSNRMIEV